MSLERVSWEIAVSMNQCKPSFDDADEWTPLKLMGKVLV